jgi:peptide/nickel transport system permease protein
VSAHTTTLTGKLEMTTPSRRPRWLTLPVALGSAVIVGWLLVALTIPWWAPYDPVQPVTERLAEPSLSHPLGSDDLGRDVLTRTLYGARVALAIAALVILGSAAIGCLLGAVSGYAGGWVDSVLMRLVDITLAFPGILLAITITAYLGREMHNIMIAIILVAWPVYARLLRGQILAVRESEHVLAARTLGAGGVRILTRHILPVAITPVLINATLDFGQIVLLAAALSFIGLGAKPPTPEWGVMVSEGSRFFYQWWIAAGPGLAIFSVAFFSNFIGDGIRDILDPHSRRR